MTTLVTFNSLALFQVRGGNQTHNVQIMGNGIGHPIVKPQLLFKQQTINGDHVRYRFKKTPSSLVGQKNTGISDTGLL
jgi:hypothetical protein